ITSPKAIIKNADMSEDAVNIATQVLEKYNTEKDIAACKYPSQWQIERKIRDADISLYGINIWNVHDAIINDLPRTNNHVEGYNSRLESNFPKHSHIYHFIELLRDEHLYQHHRAEESDMQIRKRKQLYNNIDSKLKELHEEHIKGTITNV
ncbi:unnamed protein product, partial [Didymodactylos carnosus]